MKSSFAGAVTLLLMLETQIIAAEGNPVRGQRVSQTKT